MRSPGGSGRPRVKRAKVRGIYDDLEKEIAELEAKGGKAIEAITIRLHARQAAELAKVPIFVEEALEAPRGGQQSCAFLCFQASIDACAVMLEDELKQSMVITGKTSLKARDEAIEAFNFGDLPVLVLNMRQA